jgi:hypothetical protein
MAHTVGIGIDAVLNPLEQLGSGRHRSVWLVVSVTLLM